jgi:hypothetical protein
METHAYATRWNVWPGSSVPLSLLVSPARCPWEGAHHSHCRQRLGYAAQASLSPRADTFSATTVATAGAGCSGDVSASGIVVVALTPGDRSHAGAHLVADENASGWRCRGRDHDTPYLKQPVTSSSDYGA